MTKNRWEKWDFATDKMPANDITLYAQFTKNPVAPPTTGGTHRLQQITAGILNHLPQIYLEATHLTHQQGIQLAQQVQ